MDDRIRVLIADDHPIVRQGLEVVLEAQPDMAVVGRAANGQEAVAQCATAGPDVILMDLQMPVMDGLAAIEAIQASGTHARILVLSSFPDDDKVLRALRSGAVGYVLKDTPPARLLEAIRAVHRGEVALHPDVARTLVEDVRQQAAPPPSAEPLTRRERDVLACLSRGLSNQEIADELLVSVRTVTTHVRNILGKLGLANRTQAALYAVEHGIGRGAGG